MSIATVQTRFAYGLRSDVFGNVNFLDEQNIVYPVGSNIVIYNIDQKSQRFIPSSPTSQGPSCLAVSPNRRYLAIAEKGAERGQIVIHDLVTNKKKLLQYKDMQSRSFISLSFSSDSKYLASLTDKPDQVLCHSYICILLLLIVTLLRHCCTGDGIKLKYSLLSKSQLKVQGHKVLAP